MCACMEELSVCLCVCEACMEELCVVHACMHGRAVCVCVQGRMEELRGFSQVRGWIIRSERALVVGRG